ncbi:major histocompatibility complex class I-related gene protein-like [Ahaetulla prasina]|uniref:major histocompatibility complex class I-related gene protein-like n=1 Tax=Ahaetulla prasina TaxID=499056 RepID=UPI0026475B4F|nr:major histocompatibility complex class I-related gene protein-like [Ahaetulla prasina]
MALHRAPLLLLGTVLGSFVPGALCGAPSHSLCYFYLRLSEPSKGLPQFFIRSYLDDQPIARYDNLTRKTEPLVPWMEEEEKERFLALEWVFRADLEKISKLDHHVAGLHTWQAVLGCELREDGSKEGFLHYGYGYNEKDFISLEKENLRWVTAQPQAQKVKEKWEEDPGWSERNKVFLEKTCIVWLQRYLSYQKEAPQRIEPPVGKVTRKVVDDSLEVLICQAFGFYPKEIQATWTRDGEAYIYETLPRNVAPNSDGTYYVSLSIVIEPKERKHFRCRLEHKGLQEPLVLAFKEEKATRWRIPVGIVPGLISGAAVLFLICQWWRFSEKFHHKVTTCPDQVSPEMVTSPPIRGTEDSTLGKYLEEKTMYLFQSRTKIFGSWRPQGAPEDTVSTLLSGKKKQLLTNTLTPAEADGYHHHHSHRHHHRHHHYHYCKVQ